MVELENPFSLYFHVPFCNKKCDYCHFFVLPNRPSLQIQYMDALYQEWELKKTLLQGRQLISIYFGGGTPTLIGPKNIEKILRWINPESVEITLEANPETISFAAMKEYVSVGINRVSIGVQAFNDRLLQFLGRTHSSRKAIDAIQDTFNAGIKNISIDLMYDLPHQTLFDWQETVTHATELPITHLSLYNLTFEPHTVFFKKQKELLPFVPHEDLSLEMLNFAVQTLNTSGLTRYEISAFARPSYESIHNCGYWKGRPFLGFGPSAFSDWDKSRFRNIAHLHRYKALLENGLWPEDFKETLDQEARFREELVIGLRMMEGVKKNESMPVETQKKIEQLMEDNFLETTSERIRLTAKGLLYYDWVAAELI